MQLLRIHYQKLFLCMLFVMLVLLMVRVWDDDTSWVHTAPRGPEKQVRGRDNSINIDVPVLLPLINKKSPSVKEFTELFQEITKEDTCPLCLGRDLCEDVNAGFLSLSSDIPTTTQDGGMVYQATLGDHHKLNVKVPSADALSKLDAAVCSNASLEAGCRVALAAPRSFLATPHSSLSPAVLSHLLHVLSTPRSHYSLLMCPTKRLLAVIERAFDEDDDGSLNAEERLSLYTSLATAPDIVVLKLLLKANLSIGLPRLVGVCGRVGVTEGELTPLATLLDETFSVRASLAAQLLTLLDDFMEEDPDWYLFTEDWDMGSLALNKDGEVVLSDLARLTVVDKRLFRDEYEDEVEAGGEICNRECFKAFRREVYSQGVDPDQTCARLEDVGSLMYAVVCVSVLSDMKQHKYADYFSSDSPRVVRSTRGLLHSIPSSDRPTIEQLLSECVEEVAPGGRLQAAQDLRDYLSDYLMDEEEEEDEEDEDEEEGEDEEEDEVGEEERKGDGEEEGIERENDAGNGEGYDYDET